MGSKISSRCGVKQGNALSPLLFDLFVVELEKWLQEQLPAAGVQLSPKLMQLVLYADDLVLIAPSPQLLHHMLDQLHEFCVENEMEMSVATNEIVVFRHPDFPDGGGA